MMMVGLGKHEGATTVHRAGSLNFGRLLPEAAQVFIGTGKILFGLALVENAHEETQQIEVLSADGIVSREKELLTLAKKIQGRLYLDEIDVLIVDEMGKNISGAGMDPNVTGRSGTGDPAFTVIAPKIRQIVVLGLTECSEGNAVGMGMADIISIDLARQIDLGPTYTNVLTAGVPLAGKLPLVANSETDTLSFALMALGKRALSELKIVHIKNTLELETLEVSVNYEEEIQCKKHLFDAAYEKTRLSFDPQGRLRRI